MVYVTIKKIKKQFLFIEVNTLNYEKNYLKIENNNVI